jgi:hypothetical protein
MEDRDFQRLQVAAINSSKDILRFGEKTEVTQTCILLSNTDRKNKSMWVYTHLLYIAKLEQVYINLRRLNDYCVALEAWYHGFLSDKEVLRIAVKLK